MAMATCPLVVQAQNPVVEQSAKFDDPDYGWLKTLQMKNGNTLLFHSTSKDGIEVTVYNPQRRIAGKRTLVSKLWDAGKMKQTTVRQLFEINGEAILFFVQGDGRTPVLYRMRVNGQTGAMVREDELGRLPKISMLDAYSLAFGAKDMPDIIVEKDPESSNYAVVFFNTLRGDADERIRLVHYDSTHKIITSAFYDYPGDKFDNYVFLACAVDGSKRAYLATYCYVKGQSDDASSVAISVLNAHNPKFVTKLLKFSDDFDDTKAKMLYNHHSNKMQMLSLTHTDTKHKIFSDRRVEIYNTLMSYIDPETLSLVSSIQLGGEKINQYADKNIEQGYQFKGLPENMLLTGDNRTIVVSEVNINETSRHSMGSPNDGKPHAGITKKSTILGPMGVTYMNENGAETEGFAISKRQDAAGELPMLYLDQRAKGIFQYPTTLTKHNDNQFLSFDFIPAPKASYVLFNDLSDNMDKDETETKRKTVTDPAKTNVVYYRLDPGKAYKDYLFGDPEKKNKSTYAYIESGSYNPETSTYAVVVIEQEGKEEMARMAWIKFQ